MSETSPRRIFIWSGYHSETMLDFVRFCWDNDHLLICCPPKLNDFSFVDLLPNGEISVCGQWQDNILPQLPSRITNGHQYPDKPVIGVFTTGTTRDKRKLVLLSKENISSCQNAIFELFDTTQIKNIFCYPQPYHVFGILLGYIAACRFGWTLNAGVGAYTTDHHKRWADSTNQNTMTLATPVHVRDLVQFVTQNDINPHESYTCILGGARVDASDWMNAKRILHIAKPSIGYGCTEASPGITHLPPGLKPQNDGDIGYALSHGKIEQKNKNGFRFYGPSVALASIEGTTLDFPKFIDVPDHINIKEDGRIEFSSRTDSVLNRGGEKFSLEEIERLLKSKFKVDAICLPVDDKRLGQELGIVAARTKKASLTLQRNSVYQELEKKFGRSFNQDYLVEVDTLPVNDNSKFDRRQASVLFRKGMEK